MSATDTGSPGTLWGSLPSYQMSMSSSTCRASVWRDWKLLLAQLCCAKKKNKKWNATMLQGTGCVHTWAFTVRTVFSFKALELWRKEIWKIISHVPASLPRPAKNCVFLKGRNKLLPHILFFFIAFLDAVCSAMGQFTLGLKPWQHLIYSALLQNNVRTG